MRHSLDEAARYIVGNPQRLVAQTVEVAATLSDARAGAVFLVEGESRLRLFGSVGLDERGLELTRRVWEQRSPELDRGGIYRAAQRDGAVVIVPLIDQGRVIGLLYLASSDPKFAAPETRSRLVEIGSIVTRALIKARGLAIGPLTSAVNWQDYLEQTPPQEIAREQLFVLLDRNEWNIARVARIMGVTRRTIYLRMRRFKIERQKVVRSKARAAAARA